MRDRVIFTLSAAICLACAAAVPAARAQEAVAVRFDLTGPQGGPFPADRFTVPDPAQLTGRRVNLPKPDCSARSSDCDDLDVLNTLDGFNLQPRLQVPFTGAIDPATVTSGTVFLFKLGCLVLSCPGDTRTGINQVVWDPATNTLYAESGQLLDQDARYLLVVTNGIRDPGGERIDAGQFHDVLHAGQSTDPAETAYRQALLAALGQLTDTTGMPPGQVAAASLFTTQSATAVLEKIRGQLNAATPAPAGFLLGTNGERTVFPLADVAGIAFNRQIGTAPAFSTTPLPLGQLQVIPGAAGTIAFGRYRSPGYQTAAGVIPAVGTRTGTPQVQQTNDVYFNLLLPAGPEPAGGWPVVITAPGLQTNKNAAGLAIAAKLAQHGLAMIVINAPGQGGGPLGTLTVTKTDASTVTLPAGGRGIDRNGDGAIDPDEGFFTAPDGPQAITLARDGLRQTVADLMQLVRELQGGIDVDGDSAPDLDASRIYYAGSSLGGIIGTDFAAVEPSVRAGAFNVAGGSLPDIGRLSIPLRPLLGQLLGLHVPSLLNGGPDPVNFPANPFPNPTPFRDNLPLRNQPALVNDVPGAMAIQEEIERIEWAGQSADPVAYAPHLRKDPLAGNAAKPVLYSFANGDWTVPNPTTSAILRAGGLADRATLFRFDLAYAQNPAIGTNPHGFLRNLSPAGIGPALQGQEQIAAFLGSDGQVTIDPDGPGPLFQTPIAGPLPEGICYIPFQLPCP
jgi:hypothetical protein